MNTIVNAKSLHTTATNVLEANAIRNEKLACDYVNTFVMPALKKTAEKGLFSTITPISKDICVHLAVKYLEEELGFVCDRINKTEWRISWERPREK
jgi:hypothetical protein